MSKRLRASIRANNRGRSLRPKTAQTRNSEPSLPPDEERISSEPPEPNDAQPEVQPQPTLAAATKSGKDATDLRTRETLRELPPASAPAKVENASPPVQAKPVAAAPAKPVAAAPAKSVVAAAPAKPVVAAAPAKPAASTKEPASVAKAKPASTKEPAVADKPVPSVKDVGAAPKPPTSQKKPVKAEAAKTDATKSTSKRAGDDEPPDSLSVSAEFFRRDEDTVRPVIDSHEVVEDLAPRAPPPSPAVLARRARLRRVVAGVVAFAGVISIAVIGKMVMASKQPSATVKPPVVQQDTPKDPKPAPEPPATAQNVATAEPAKPAETADPKAADTADPKAAEAKAEEDAKKAEPSADAAALRKEALGLLNRGKLKDVIPKAREAIAADPTDATAYLYLGSALQDTGHWKDGLEAYNECVRNATKGPVHECRQMGGRK